jgi:F-type H+-transporting ATPase subunit epsilon
MQVNTKIATLQGIFLEKPVQMAIIPAFDGEVGILPSHIPCVFKLESGLIKLYDIQSSSKEKIFIFGGFAKISEERLDVVTDKAMHIEDIDIKATNEKIQLLEAQLLSSEDEIFLTSVQTDLTLHRKMLEAASAR